MRAPRRALQRWRERPSPRPEPAGGLRSSARARAVLVGSRGRPRPSPPKPCRLTNCGWSRGGYAIGRARPRAPRSRWTARWPWARRRTSGLFVIGFDRDAQPDQTLETQQRRPGSADRSLTIAPTAYDVQRVGRPAAVIMVTPTDPRPCWNASSARAALKAERLPRESRRRRTEFKDGFRWPLGRTFVVSSRFGNPSFASSNGTTVEAAPLWHRPRRAHRHSDPRAGPGHLFGGAGRTRHAFRWRHHPGSRPWPGADLLSICTSPGSSVHKGDIRSQRQTAHRPWWA